MTKYLFKILKPKFIFTEVEELKIFSEVAIEMNLNVKIITYTKVFDYYYINDILNESTSHEVNEFSPTAPLNPNDDCILPLTSGTTGDSKILSHSYKAIMEGLLVHNMNKETTSNDVSLVYLPIYWLIGLRVMLSDVLNFTTRIVINETSYDLHEAFQLIQKYKVTKVRFSLGMMYRIFKWRKLETYDRSSLKTLTFNGVKLPAEMIKFMMTVAKNGIVEQTYGATEMSIPMSRGIMNKIDPNSCGSLYPNMSMKVIDVRSGENLGPKESGEICFKSPYLMKGYCKHPEATARAIDPEGWYHTGDLGYYEESGLVFVLGRVKNSKVLPNGKIIPLWQIERSLLLNSEVIETIVLTSDENSDTYKLFAFVVLLSGSKITEKELSEIVNDFTDIEFPVIVKIVDELPLTKTGKVNLWKLKKRVL
ncbi:4-coumarate--CoA ligase 1-like isoform X2 [Leptopilina heterotoma]|nr:4-coumarate--CoA ligase 1-like isoform X2 [Leptopilina heterotoma]